MSRHPNAVRWAAGGLAVAAVLFLLYPLARPWHDEATQTGATAAMSAGAWTASHVCAMLALTLLPPGLLALHHVVRPTRGRPVAAAAVVTGWLGVSLTLPYYGAETFGLQALGEAAVSGTITDLPALAELVRFQPVAVATFAAGLVLLAATGVLAAVAVTRSGTLPRWSGLPLAVGLATFLPQFYAPAPVRIAHGLVTALGLLWLSIVLGRRADGP